MDYSMLALVNSEITTAIHDLHGSSIFLSGFHREQSVS